MKTLLTVVLLIFIYSTSSAQFIKSYGIKGGATFANEKWEYTNNTFSDPTDNRTGINVGVFAELLELPFYSIVTELNYVQKGIELTYIFTTVENPFGAGEKTTSFRTDYLNLSFLNKLRLETNLFSFYLLAGPKFDFRIHEAFDDNHSDNYKKLLFGFKVGVGTEVSIHSYNLLVEVLYDHDLNKLYENDLVEISTNSIDLRVGIGF